MRTFGVICLVLVVLPIDCVGCWMLNRTASVVDKEFSPGALLKKYERFKDMAAKLDAKRANIKATEQQLKSLESQYEGVARKDWPRHDAEQHGLWMAAITGMKASYNGLAAEYNSSMSKENYRFCNVGDLPKGASDPLPREFVSYLEK